MGGKFYRLVFSSRSLLLQRNQFKCVCENIMSDTLRKQTKSSSYIKNFPRERNQLIFQVTHVISLHLYELEGFINTSQFAIMRIMLANYVLKSF